jgi:hypothetical protein
MIYQYIVQRHKSTVSYRESYSYYRRLVLLYRSPSLPRTFSQPDVMLALYVVSMVVTLTSHRILLQKYC